MLKQVLTILLLCNACLHPVQAGYTEISPDPDFPNATNSESPPQSRQIDDKNYKTGPASILPPQTSENKSYTEKSTVEGRDAVGKSAGVSSSGNGNEAHDGVRKITPFMLGKTVNQSQDQDGDSTMVFSSGKNTSDRSFSEGSDVDVTNPAENVAMSKRKDKSKQSTSSEEIADNKDETGYSFTSRNGSATVSEDDDDDLVIPERPRTRFDNSRILFLSGLAMSLLRRENNLLDEGENTNEDDAVLEEHTNESDVNLDRNFQFMMSKESENKLPNPKTDLDGFKTEDMNPDVTSLLGKCGVFPACHVVVFESESKGVLIFEHFEVDKLNGEQISGQIDHNTADQLVAWRELVGVVCEPTSVSVIASFAIVLAIMIIVSNFLIIVVTLRTKSLRKPHGYFKISLAAADFINGAFVLTNVSANLLRFIHFDDKDREQIDQMRQREPNYGETVFFGVCAVLSHVVTVYSVLLLSINSFLSVRWPVQYRVGDLITTRRAVGSVAAIWIFALAVSSLPLLAKDYVRYGLSYSTFSYFPVVDPPPTVMSNDNAFIMRHTHVILYAALVWGLPFVVTWLLTILTGYHSRLMLRGMSKAQRKAPRFSRNIGRLERDILRTVTVVLAMLTITVLPMLIALLAVALTSEDNELCIEQPIVNMMFAAYYVLVCGSFVNVIVYNACHKEFRRAMIDFLCDAMARVFSCCCPGFCALRSGKSSKSVRSKSTSATGIGSKRLCTITSKRRICAPQTSVSGISPVVRRQKAQAINTPSTSTSNVSVRTRRLSCGDNVTPQGLRRLGHDRSASLSSAMSLSLQQELAQRANRNFARPFGPRCASAAQIEARLDGDHGEVRGNFTLSV